MAAAMAIAVQSQGWHSTAGIRCSLLNLPGAILGGLAGDLAEDSLLIVLPVTALANWAFYFWTVRGLLLLKHKFWPTS